MATKEVEDMRVKLAMAETAALEAAQAWDEQDLFMGWVG